MTSIYNIKQKKMATVPKLSYTNIKNKKKTNKQQLQGLSLSNRSSQLFAHMNQDNLSYIQTQIKQKNKKARPPPLSQQIIMEQQQKKKSKQNSVYIVKTQQQQQHYPHTPELLSPTIYPGIPVAKTEGEKQSGGFSPLHLASYMNRKLSHVQQRNYVDGLNQNRKMSQTPISHCQKNNETVPTKNGFLNFLEHYIEDLYQSGKQKQSIAKRNNKNKRNDKSIDKNKDKSNKRQLHSAFLKKSIKSPQLSNYSYKQQNQHFLGNLRLDRLESAIFSLVNEVQQIKGLMKISSNSKIQLYNNRTTTPIYSLYNSRQANRQIDNNNERIYGFEQYQQHYKQQYKQQQLLYTKQKSTKSSLDRHHSYSNIYINHKNSQKQQEIHNLQKQYKQFLANQTLYLKEY